MSSESDYAWRMARFYGPTLVQLTRAERIDYLCKQIAHLQNLGHEESVAHKATCPECQAGEFCLYNFSLTPEKRKRYDQIKFMNGIIYSEEQDEQYAQRARTNPVQYEHHVDGFCSYWQNVRHRKFEAVGWKCERCGIGLENGSLEAHHRYYDTLGFEELRDLQALCRRCHEMADRERIAYTQYGNGLNTYMRKKYGNDWEYRIDTERAEDEFDRWLEDKQEQTWND